MIFRDKLKFFGALQEKLTEPLRQQYHIIPGAVIAAALMPPLCTCGYSIANRNRHMLPGAAYLFIINAYFIYAASSAVLFPPGTPPARELPPGSGTGR